MDNMLYYHADDGARIAYRDSAEAAQPQSLPVLALSGLTRDGRDFDYMAPYLQGCRLIRMDYRGRGGSEFTGEASYTVPREAQDALNLLDYLGIERAAIIGTSRGGLVGMYLAKVAHTRLRGLCLVDVGPALEHRGLVRIFDYLGHNPAAQSFEALAQKMPRAMPGFEGVPLSRWLEETQRHYVMREGRLKITYDPALKRPFMQAFAGATVPTAWPLFAACAGLPLALIRGANSDLLSAETAQEMLRQRPDMVFAQVPGRGHVPFLDEPEALAGLRRWLENMRLG